MPYRRATDDPYAALGLSHDATDEQIKAAYRKLAMKLHPDRNPGDKEKEEEFKRVSSAYETLSDPQKRAEFDAQSSLFSRGGRRPGASDPFAGFSGDFGDVFGDLFGGRSARQRFFQVDITLEQSAFGAEVDLALPGSDSFRARIPPGVSDGDILRVQPPGSATQIDLHISVLPHAIFTPDGSDLRADLLVPFHVAALGGSASTPSLGGGELSVRIPPETSTGSTLRLRGQGLPLRSSGGSAARGDLLLRILPIVPSGLDDKQKALLRKFAASLEPGPKKS